MRQSTAQMLGPALEVVAHEAQAGEDRRPARLRPDGGNLRYGDDPEAVRLLKQARDLSRIRSAELLARAAKCMARAQAAYLSRQTPEAADKLARSPVLAEALSLTAKARGVDEDAYQRAVFKVADKRRAEQASELAHIAARRAREAEIARLEADPWGALKEDANIGALHAHALAQADLFPLTARHDDKLRGFANRAVAAWLAADGRDVKEIPGVQGPDPEAVANGERRSLAFSGFGPGGVDWSGLGLDDSLLKTFPVDWSSACFDGADKARADDWQMAWDGHPAAVGKATMNGIDGDLVLLVEDGQVVPLVQTTASDGSLKTILPPSANSLRIAEAVVAVWQMDAQRLDAADPSAPPRVFRVGESLSGPALGHALLACASRGVEYDLHDDTLARLVDNFEISGFDFGCDHRERMLAQAAFATSVALTETGTWPDYRHGAFRAIMETHDDRAYYLGKVSDALLTAGMSKQAVEHTIGDIVHLSEPMPPPEVIEAVARHDAEHAMGRHGPTFVAPGSWPVEPEYEC